MAALGPIDAHVDDAGFVRPATLHRITSERRARVLRVHADASFHCLRVVVSGMMERSNGRIVYVTSAGGVLATIGQVDDRAAKADIPGLTMSAARELTGEGIVVNAIGPGAATPMTGTIRAEERFRDRRLERIPMGARAPTTSRRHPCSMPGPARATLPASDRRRRRHDDTLSAASAPPGVLR